MVSGISISFSQASIVLSCGNCGKTDEKLLRCSRCKFEKYCGQDCQRDHWPKHKQVCQIKSQEKQEKTSSLSSANLKWEDQLSYLVKSVKEKEVSQLSNLPMLREILKDLKNVDKSKEDLAIKWLIRLLSFPNEEIQEKAFEILVIKMDLSTFCFDTQESEQPKFIFQFSKDKKLSKFKTLYLLQLGNLFFVQNRIEVAIHYFTIMAFIAQRQGDLEAEGNAEINIGAAYIELGNCGKAIKKIERGLKKIQDTASKCTAYSQLGNAFQELKIFEKAIENYENCKLFEKKALIPEEIALTVGVRINLSNAYLEIGKPEKAILNLEEVDGKIEDVKDNHLKAIYYANMGRAKSDTGQHIVALFNYDKSLSYCKGTDSEDEARAYGGIGKAHSLMGDHQQSIHYFELSLKISIKINHYYYLSQGYSSQGLSFSFLGQHLKALDSFNKALKASITLNDVVEKGRNYTNLGMIYFKLLDYKSAEENFRMGVNCFFEIQDIMKENEFKIAIFEEQGKALLGLEFSLHKQNKTEEALQVTDCRRSRALISALSQKLKESQPLPTRFMTIQEMQALAFKLKTTFVVYSLMTLGDGKKEANIWIISQESKIIHETVDIGVILKDLEGFEELLKNTPFERTRGKSQNISIPCLKEFEKLVRGEELLAVQLAREEFIEEKLGPWYQSLISPIEKYLPSDPDQTVTIIPDGFLAQFPFAAFHNVSDGKYLIEKHPISIAPSITTLDLLHQISCLRKQDYKEKALVIGNPDVTDPKFKDKTLEISQQEALEIAKLLEADKESVLIHKEATVTKVIEQAPHVRWIFASCHGEADCKSDYDPHSVFEGQLKLSPDLEHTNGNLHSQLISTLDLKAELVFLSACYSGTGKIKREGTIGNVWSFLSAGALSTVATYWPLKESETTKEMVNCFYKHMLGIDTPKLNKAQALQRAIIFGMEKDRDNFAQWGAFYLSGLSDVEYCTEHREQNPATIPKEAPFIKKQSHHHTGFLNSKVLRHKQHWNQHNIAQLLWLDPLVIISDEMVTKVREVDNYLTTQGFRLMGVIADGNCFFNAFLGSYETLDRKIPLLDEQENKIAFLRQMAADKYKLTRQGSKNSDRAEEIKRDKEWIVAFDEGDLLAITLSIPMRIITVNKDDSGCGIIDMVVFSQPNRPKQEWDTIPEDEKPKKYICIVDLGGHFIYAQNINVSK